MSLPAVTYPDINDRVIVPNNRRVFRITEIALGASFTSVPRFRATTVRPSIQIKGRFDGLTWDKKANAWRWEEKSFKK